MQLAELENEVYLLNDQPTTCPACGARTDMVANISRLLKSGSVEKCLNEKCGKVFIVDEETPV